MKQVRNAYEKNPDWTIPRKEAKIWRARQDGCSNTITTFEVDNPVIEPVYD